ncbi:MAG: hypothetical protein LRY37_01530 [Alkalibacterium thalassium]|nr:hypothetical protein [Alkalibacterium thalassium]
MKHIISESLFDLKNVSQPIVLDDRIFLYGNSNGQRKKMLPDFFVEHRSEIEGTDHVDR